MYSSADFYYIFTSAFLMSTNLRTSGTVLTKRTLLESCGLCTIFIFLRTAIVVNNNRRAELMSYIKLFYSTNNHPTGTGN